MALRNNQGGNAVADARMTGALPRVSIVTETLTPQEGEESVGEAMTRLSAAIAAQSYPRDLVELVVVIDPVMPAGDRAELAASVPGATLIEGNNSHYLAAKNRGAAAAGHDLLVFLDSDCVPVPTWLESLIGAVTPARGGAVGRTRYAGDGLFLRSASALIFGGAWLGQGGEASAVNINNLAIRRDLYRQFGLNEDIPRNGGCYLLFHQLRAHGHRFGYAPDAVVLHPPEPGVAGFFHRQWERGYDSAFVYRLDRDAVLRGTRWVERLGPFALVAISGRRLAIDWRNLFVSRRIFGLRRRELPFALAMFGAVRATELTGAVAGYFAARGRAGAQPTSRSGPSRAGTG
ncbi:MAG: glycosyltransferase [Pseudomonadota bacterium]